MKLIEIAIREYTDDEKKRLGIPSGAIARGGSWYVGGKYVGKVRNKKFVPATVKPDPTRTVTTPKQSTVGQTETPPTVDNTPKVKVISAPTKPNPSFDELRDEARKHTYTVMTKVPLSTIRSENPVNSTTNPVGKPGGFWFGVGPEWIDWTENDMPEWKGDNLYSVEVDEKQCVVIENERDLRLFHNQYRTPNGMINWEKVAKDHKGIIIKNYIPEARMKYPWFYSWDVASGCVWDSSAIKQVKQESIK